MSGLMNSYVFKRSPKKTREVAGQYLGQVSEIITEVERAQSTICQELLTLKTQQQLEEVSNVTKLIELAFVFVPLSPVQCSKYKIKELHKAVSLFVSSWLVLLQWVGVCNSICYTKSQHS